MNKYKKIAAIAATAVMAGSMVGTMAACAPTEETVVRPSVFTGYTADTQLNLGIGFEGDSTGVRITYDTNELSGSTKMVDGKDYSAGSLKPAWQALQDRLRLKFNDAYVVRKTSDEAISIPVTDGTLSSFDILTGSMSAISTRTVNFVDLDYYIDLMPNYKAFLEANPVVRYSLTSTPGSSSMYAAPYFDGLNDIEKYELFDQVWAKTILNTGDATQAQGTTFAAQASRKNETGLDISGTSAKIKSYMGTTGTWEVQTTDSSDATGATLTTLVVNYDYALAQAKQDGTALYSAINAAAGAAYTGTSGNIVDMMNFVIDKKSGGVAGKDLIPILRSYIDVAYQKKGTPANTSFYGANRENVFIGVDAGWDVDLLAAYSRCIVTSPELLGLGTRSVAKVFGIAARAAQTPRRNDLITLAGTLYGFRGADPSRYEYTYIDANGVLQDSRANAETYEMLNNFSAFAREGLMSIVDFENDTYVPTDANTHTQAAMIHDYAQTQTTHGLAITGGTTNLDKYNFAPVVTPVSKWDEDCVSTNGHEKIMRFTESWRSVKNTGFCVPKHVESDANKLNAVLAFIDYFFSPDGQILMTYGPEADNATYTNGFWKGEVATDVTLSQVADVYVSQDALKTPELAEGETADATKVLNYYPTQYTMKSQYVGQYFVYNGKVYKGESYNGRVVPKMTDNNMNFYLGTQVEVAPDEKIQLKSGNIKISAAGNYTRYARRVVGTTLPIGNKDQGFEYQCTATCALEGAARVAKCLVNGTVKHVKLSVDSDETMWYLIVPSALPLNSADRQTLTEGDQKILQDTYFVANKDAKLNAYLDVAFFGFNTAKNICGNSTNGSVKESGEAYVTWVNGRGMSTRLAIMRDAWDALKDIYDL